MVFIAIFCSFLATSFSSIAMEKKKSYYFCELSEEECDRHHEALANTPYMRKIRERWDKKHELESQTPNECSLSSSSRTQSMFSGLIATVNYYIFGDDYDYEKYSIGNSLGSINQIFSSLIEYKQIDGDKRLTLDEMEIAAKISVLEDAIIDGTIAPIQFSTLDEIKDFKLSLDDQTKEVTLFLEYLRAGAKSSFIEEYPELNEDFEKAIEKSLVWLNKRVNKSVSALKFISVSNRWSWQYFLDKAKELREQSLVSMCSNKINDFAFWLRRGEEAAQRKLALASLDEIYLKLWQNIRTFGDFELCGKIKFLFDEIKSGRQAPLLFSHSSEVAKLELDFKGQIGAQLEAIKLLKKMALGALVHKNFHLEMDESALKLTSLRNEKNPQPEHENIFKDLIGRVEKSCEKWCSDEARMNLQVGDLPWAAGSSGGYQEADLRRNPWAKSFYELAAKSDIFHTEALDHQKYESLSAQVPLLFLPTLNTSSQCPLLGK